MDQMFQGKLPFSIGNGNRVHPSYAVFYNDEFEAEAREKMQLPFVKTAFLCFAFAELYRLGESAKLPGFVSEKDFKRAAYWQLQALFLGGASGFNDAEFMSDDYVMVLSQFLKSEQRDLDSVVTRFPTKEPNI